MHRRVARYLVLWVSIAICGCAHFPRNQQLVPAEQNSRYDYDSSNNGDLTVALSLSGGGARAAAFAYGVIKELNETRLGDSTNLLDEVDIVSAVSGGSITAAFWAVHGRTGLLNDFPTRFLHHPIERDLVFKFLSPINRFRLMGQTFERVDLVAEYVGSQLLDDKTFGHLLHTKKACADENADCGYKYDPPFFLINATDISRGTRFGFTQERFNQLCSNLNSYPLARAVAASASVPGVSSPVTLENFGTVQCGFDEPEWVEGVLSAKPSTVSPRQVRKARSIRDYRDETRVGWVHLFDGGVADNLGVQGLYDVAFRTDRDCTEIERSRVAKMKKLVVIAVDAMPDLGHEADLEKIGPDITETMRNAVSIPVDRLTELTIDTIRPRLQEWIRHCDGDLGQDDIHSILVRIPELEGLEDTTYVGRLSKTGTRLSLDDETDELLVTAGREQLRTAPEFQRLLESIPHEELAGDAAMQESAGLSIDDEG